MPRLDADVRDAPKSKVDRNGRPYTPQSAAADVGRALGILSGRWKLLILFHLFDGKVLRFSDLERAIGGISQKMLIQQLRQLEAAGMVERIVHAQVPPKVEYRLTEWGQALCPALDAMLEWSAQRDRLSASER